MKPATSFSLQGFVSLTVSLSNVSTPEESTGDFSKTTDQVVDDRLVQVGVGVSEEDVAELLRGEKGVDHLPVFFIDYESVLQGSGYLGYVDSNQGYNLYEWVICPLTRVISYKPTYNQLLSILNL